MPIATNDQVRRASPFDTGDTANYPVDTSGRGLGGATTPGQDLGSTLGAIWSAIQGFSGGQNSDIGRANTAAHMADPYMDQRSQWWPQIQQQMQGIQGLMADPSSFLKDPMFTAPLKLGGEALARQYGAAGLGNSGNVGLAETKFGQSFADQYLQEQLGNMRANLGQLSNLGGVNAGSPTGAANAYLQGTGTQRNDIGSALGLLGNLLGSGLGGLGGLSKLFGGGGGDGGGMPWLDPNSTDQGIYGDPTNPTNPLTGGPPDYTYGFDDPPITSLPDTGSFDLGSLFDW